MLTQKQLGQVQQGAALWVLDHGQYPVGDSLPWAAGAMRVLHSMGVLGVLCGGTARWRCVSPELGSDRCWSVRWDLERSRKQMAIGRDPVCHCWVQIQDQGGGPDWVLDTTVGWQRQACEWMGQEWSGIRMQAPLYSRLDRLQGCHYDIDDTATMLAVARTVRDYAGIPIALVQGEGEQND